MVSDGVGTGSREVTAATGEAPRHLDLSVPPPRPLGLLDQTILWLSMGASLLIAAAAVFVLYPVVGGPALSLPAAVTVVVVGVLAGAALLALAAMVGARSGAPAMAMLRGLLGRRTSYLPTSLNLLQCFGWAAVEIFVISTVATALTGDGWRPVWVLAAGALATVMAVRPLGMVKVIRRYLGWLVLASTVVLMIGLVRSGVQQPAGGDWSGFWVAFDVVVALPISWVPLAADFTRHSRTPRAAGIGVLVGYTVSCTAFFLLGILAVLTLSNLTGAVTPTSFAIGLIGLPLGTLAMVVLLLDEVDKAFANIYSTAMSGQNVVQRVDRRVLAVGIGAAATVAALLADLEQYESFLFLIGAVFVRWRSCSRPTATWYVAWSSVRSGALRRRRPGPRRSAAAAALGRTGSSPTSWSTPGLVEGWSKPVGRPARRPRAGATGLAGGVGGGCRRRVRRDRGGGDPLAVGLRGTARGRLPAGARAADAADRREGDTMAG